MSPLIIWCAGRHGRKHRECSLRPWYANSSLNFAVQCRASLMSTNLLSISSTGADDKGLHQRGSTKPLRLCEHKARSKAADVRILDHQSRLTLARYIRLTIVSITPTNSTADSPTPSDKSIFCLLSYPPLCSISCADPLLLGFE